MMLNDFAYEILEVSEESLGGDETWRQTSHEHFTSICQLLPFCCFDNVVVIIPDRGGVGSNPARGMKSFLAMKMSIRSCPSLVPSLTSLLTNHI